MVLEMCLHSVCMCVRAGFLPVWMKEANQPCSLWLSATDWAAGAQTPKPLPGALVCKRLQEQGLLSSCRTPVLSLSTPTRHWG